MPGEILVVWKNCAHVSQDSPGKVITAFLFLDVGTSPPTPFGKVDTTTQNAFTSSLKSSSPFFRICSWSHTTNMHFYVHKEDITNIEKGSVN